MSTRQLALPGMPKVAVLARSPLAARRDLSEAEFARALHKLGFVPEGDALRYVDPTAPAGHRVVDAVTRCNPMRIARRATLSKLVRARKAAEENRP